MPDAGAPLTQFKAVIATAEIPRLGPQQRPGTLREAELERKLTDYFAAAGIALPAQPLLRSAALLWHDHLHASHTISQSIETREGSWLHGIMHRREPDYGNAKYWFRRVGRHEGFTKLAERAGKLLNERGPLCDRLIRSGEWQPLTFVDECERAEQGNDPDLTLSLRQIQAAEFDVLAEYILSHRP